MHYIKTNDEKRFLFGANWRRFLTVLDESRIAEAEKSLRDALKVESFSNLKVLDVGCGSGLFSLAFKRLGAQVHSFDFDMESVACTKELKRRYFPTDTKWKIEQGSVLDDEYLSKLGNNDIVYSWGVLHHTGNMAKALKNVGLLVKENGLLYISIYNDQGVVSKAWAKVKRTYCSSSIGKLGVLLLLIPMFTVLNLGVSVYEYGNPLKKFTLHKHKRGMSIYHDWIDWLGGNPYEVSKPETIFNLFQTSGFSLEHLKTTQKLGCNEFVFRKLTEQQVLST